MKRIVVLLLFGGASLYADALPAGVVPTPDAFLPIAATDEIPIAPSAFDIVAVRHDSNFESPADPLSAGWLQRTTTAYLVGGIESSLDLPPTEVRGDRFGIPVGFALFAGAILLIYHSEGYRNWYQRMFGSLDNY